MLTFLSFPLKGFRSKWNPLYPAALELKIVLRAQLPAKADLPQCVWKIKEEKKQEITQLIITAGFC